jgi:hypothetical protein
VAGAAAEAERRPIVAGNYDFVTASTLLRDGIYEVPDYQRNYAWEQQQLRDFWEDVTGILPASEHYTGTVILKKLEDLTRLGKAFGRFELVDGQQRLATIVILLAAISEQLGSQASAEANQTAANVLTDYVHDASTDTYKLRLNRGDHDFLKDVILPRDSQEVVGKEPSTPSEVKLLDAKRYFTAQVGNKSEPELQDLIGKVLNGLRFTRFQVGTDAEAGLIFEVTNNRGRPLDQLDKIKNYLMYVSYKAGDPQLATEINEAWAEILRNMLSSGGLSEGHILRYHWLMRTGEWKEYDVHRKLKASLAPPFSERHLGEIRSYVGTLKETSYVIRELSNPEGAFADWPRTEAERIAVLLRGLHRLRVLATFLPLLVASRIALKAHAHLFKDVVAACEAFALRVYKIANHRADTGLSMFARQARQMFSARGASTSQLEDATKGVLKAIQAYVRDYGSDDVVRGALSGEKIYGGTLDGYEIRYLLAEFERWQCAAAREEALRWSELEKASIEHILPQSPDDMDQWSDDQWSAHWRVRDSLGNLTLTFWNSELSNKPFHEKRLKYAESNLRIQRELAQRSTWQGAEIEQRRDELIRFVLTRWSVPP